jgi:uncharacterized protein (DUF1778 family)
MPKALKTESIQVRYSKEERQLIEQVSDEDGAFMSEWVRDVSVAAARKKAKR